MRVRIKEGIQKQENLSIDKNIWFILLKQARIKRNFIEWKMI